MSTGPDRNEHTKTKTLSSDCYPIIHSGLQSIHPSGVNRKMRRFLDTAKGQKALEEFKARQKLKMGIK